MKNEIRKENKARRSLMEQVEVLDKSSKACKSFLENDLYKNANVLMLYMALGNETDTSDITQQAFADGKKIVLPVTDAKTGDITPCYYDKNSTLSKGAFSIKEPCSMNVANAMDIDVVIVPGIAFDKSGARVGFGKGCYDRFLSKTDAIKIGFCYEFQLKEVVPSQDHDIKMDYIVTETGIFQC